MQRGLRTALIVGIVSVFVTALVVLGFYRHSKVVSELDRSKAHIAAVEASRDEVLRMYREARENLTAVELEINEVERKLQDAIRNDQDSSDWASQRIPERVRESLRLR